MGSVSIRSVCRRVLASQVWRQILATRAGIIVETYSVPQHEQREKNGTLPVSVSSYGADVRSG